VELKTAINAEAALAALRKFPEATQKQLRLATKISLRDIQVGAQQNHAFTTRGGMADKSVTPAANADGLGGRVFLDTGIANYAPFLHTGTGIHGPSGKPFSIEAKSGKSLRFVSGGRFIFRRRVMNPGIKGDPFLYRAADREEKNIVERFDKAVATAITEGGLK
jgi:hypothetical protein